ncbi:MAG: acyl-CoA dehydrogenase family protein [Myxococcales bacterium]|nr:pimeloyl-CoA dehydrogenase large subunit [Myxococcales bacterium]HIK85727.1 pimeloyl-CoA dehydrogenase large subunit [Myxococcales bacterium]
MDLSYTPEQDQFRDEVRSWIAEAMPATMRKHAEDGANFENAEVMEWHKILFAKGWAAPGWPEEVGGTGWDVAQRSIFQEECVRANAPSLSPFGLAMVGPLIIQYGNDEQKKRFLPKILAGEEIWCQGYSEPNAGSDLANLQLRAEADGDDYILNGQKTWTTYAQYADWIFVLCRTSTEGKKQEGISFLLVDIHNTDGIDVKPFLTTGGTLAFSETWFKDARVPQANRVGPENGGWSMAKALLGHERTGIGGITESDRGLSAVKHIAQRTAVGSQTLFDDPGFRRRIARKQMRLRAIEIFNLRALAAAQVGHAPGAESSVLKIVGTELQQEVTELQMDAMGHNAMGWLDSPEEALPSHQQAIASQFNYLRAATIYGGSNEIQKNIISKHLLRLPSA